MKYHQQTQMTKTLERNDKVFTVQYDIQVTWFQLHYSMARE